MSKNYRIPFPIIDFMPPVYACRYNPKPFVLDGNINKDFWKEIPFTDEFQDIEGPTLPTPCFSTRAKIAWDDRNVYFAAVLEGDEIWSHVTEHDDVIFRDNDFEIFIDPDSDTQQYYEFEMNARNVYWDLLLTKAYRDNGKPTNAFDIKGIKTAVMIDGRLNDPSAENVRWSVEVVMPFTTLIECTPKNQLPAVGDYWRLNFSRVQWKVDVKDNEFVKRTNPETGAPLPEDNWVWAPTGVINIHYPEMWGFLFFADENGNVDCSIPEDEKRRWQLRQVYYCQRHYLEDNKHYASDLADLADYLTECRKTCGSSEFTVPMTMEATKHTFVVRCRNAADTGDLYVLSDGKGGCILDDARDDTYL